MDEGRKV